MKEGGRTASGESMPSKCSTVVALALALVFLPPLLPASSSSELELARASFKEGGTKASSPSSSCPLSSTMALDRGRAGRLADGPPTVEEAAMPRAPARLLLLPPPALALVGLPRAWMDDSGLLRRARAPVVLLLLLLPPLSAAAHRVALRRTAGGGLPPLPPLKRPLPPLPGPPGRLVPVLRREVCRGPTAGRGGGPHPLASPDRLRREANVAADSGRSGGVPMPPPPEPAEKDPDDSRPLLAIFASPSYEPRLPMLPLRLRPARPSRPDSPKLSLLLPKQKERVPCTIRQRMS